MEEPREEKVERLERQLKPCPVCGRKARLKRIDSFGQWLWYAECQAPTDGLIPCGWNAAMYERPDMAVQAWNRRCEDEMKRDESDDYETCVRRVADEVADLAIHKVRAYGKSVLEPVRIFSKADALEQIRMRIDDKLSRLRSTGIDQDSEEKIILGLLGYLVLLRVAKEVHKDRPACGLAAADDPRR